MTVHCVLIKSDNEERTILFCPEGGESLQECVEAYCREHPDFSNGKHLDVWRPFFADFPDEMWKAHSIHSGSDTSYSYMYTETVFTLATEKLCGMDTESLIHFLG